MTEPADCVLGAALRAPRSESLPANGEREPSGVQHPDGLCRSITVTDRGSTGNERTAKDRSKTATLRFAHRMLRGASDEVERLNPRPNRATTLVANGRELHTVREAPLPDYPVGAYSGGGIDSRFLDRSSRRQVLGKNRDDCDQDVGRRRNCLRAV